MNKARLKKTQNKPASGKKEEYACTKCGYEAYKMAKMSHCPLCVICRRCSREVRKCRCREGE